MQRPLETSTVCVRQLLDSLEADLFQQDPLEIIWPQFQRLVALLELRRHPRGLRIRRPWLWFQDEAPSWMQRREDTREEVNQAVVACIQVDPLGDRERKNAAVARLVRRDLLRDPVRLLEPEVGREEGYLLRHDISPRDLAVPPSTPLVRLLLGRFDILRQEVLRR